MNESYQPKGTARVLFWVLASFVLMWFPVRGGGDSTSVVLETLANGFHGLWFAIGAWVIAGRLPKKTVLVWVCLAVFGSLLELGQCWVPGRSAGWLDGSWNMVGAALGLLAWRRR